jgi:peptide/nickel transport system permease protein
MLAFLLGRLAGGAVAVVAVTAGIHALMMLSPGDPLVALYGSAVRTMPAAELARLRTEAGLDRPWPAQYAAFLAAAVRGDLGTSRRTGRPVTAELRDRLPFTALLTLVALPLAILPGLAAGLAAGARARTWLDTALTASVVVVAALPVYWTALLLMMVFSLWLGWLPSSGSGAWHHLVLPAATLGLASAAPLARVARASLLDALAEPHVVVARAKGLSARAVLLRHGLRNALVPVVTVAGMDVGRMLSGAVFVETAFGWPGVGRLMVDAIASRDLPLVQGIVIVGALTVLLLSLLVDLIYLRLDPRVRYR